MGSLCSSSTQQAVRSEQSSVVHYMEAEELKKWLVAEFGDAPNSPMYPTTAQYQVIDVRNSDFNEYGHKIKGAMNHPAKADISDILKLYKDKQMVIFHCMFSEIRGPSTARRYHHERAEKYQKAQPQQVRILSGGFVGFWKKFNGDKQKDILFAKI